MRDDTEEGCNVQGRWGGCEDEGDCVDEGICGDGGVIVFTYNMRSDKSEIIKKKHNQGKIMTQESSDF